MHQKNAVEQSEAVEEEDVTPRKRRLVLQWSLQTLLLLTAAVAVWVAYFRLRQQIPRLEQQIASMQQMARELLVQDEKQIAVVMLPQMWFDESRWEIHLPQGEYMMRLATREIDEKGFAPAVGETLIGAGRHRIELMQSDEGNGRTITVMVDDQPSIEAEEGSDWDPSHGCSGGSEFGNCTHLSPHEPLILFRRRFYRRTKTGQNTAPKGPTDGLMLWIEPTEPANAAGADL